MTGLEKFEMYLNKKLDHTKMMLSVLSGSRDFNNEDEKDFLHREKILLDDVLYHYNLFLSSEKGDSETEDV